MADIKRVVRFDYFEVVLEYNDGTADSYFSIADWIQKLPKQLPDRNIEIGSIVRCDDTRAQNENSYQYLYLHFTKLRSSDTPAVAKLSTVDMEDVKLKDDEYIAEDVSMLFDNSAYTLMLQRNRYSLGVTALEKYMNYFWNKTENNSKIRLRPILYKSQYNKVKKAKRFKSFSFTAANLRNEDTIKNPFSGSLQKLMRGFEEYKGYNVTVSISVGRHTTKSLDAEGIKELAAEVQEESKNIASAQIKLVDENDLSTKLDLIDGKISSFLSFTLPPKESLRKDAVETRMIAEYFPLGENKKAYIMKNRA